MIGEIWREAPPVPQETARTVRIVEFVYATSIVYEDANGRRTKTHPATFTRRWYPIYRGTDLTRQWALLSGFVPTP